MIGKRGPSESKIFHCEGWSDPERNPSFLAQEKNMVSLYLFVWFGLNMAFQLFLAQNCQLNKSFLSSQFSVNQLFPVKK